MTGKYVDTFLRWEMIKMEVRSYALQFRARKKKANQNKLEALIRKKQQIINEQARLNENENVIFQDHELQLTLVNKDIDEIMQVKTQYAMLKCKQDYYDGGENVLHTFSILKKVGLTRKRLKQLEQIREKAKFPMTQMLFLMKWSNFIESSMHQTAGLLTPIILMI